MSAAHASSRRIGGIGVGGTVVTSRVSIGGIGVSEVSIVVWAQCRCGLF